MAANPVIPQVLMARDRDEDATQAWAMQEARYVIQMMNEGGCTYNEDEDGGRAALRACQQYLKRCGA